VFVFFALFLQSTLSAVVFLVLRTCIAHFFERNDLVLDAEEVYATAKEVGK
jgi:hypothetical protein